MTARINVRDVVIVPFFISATVLAPRETDAETLSFLKGTCKVVRQERVVLATYEDVEGQECIRVLDYHLEPIDIPAAFVTLVETDVIDAELDQSVVRDIASDLAGASSIVRYSR